MRLVERLKLLPRWQVLEAHEEEVGVIAARGTAGLGLLARLLIHHLVSFDKLELARLTDDRLAHNALLYVKRNCLAKRALQEPGVLLELLLMLAVRPKLHLGARLHLEEQLLLGKHQHLPLGFREMSLVFIH